MKYDPGVPFSTSTTFKPAVQTTPYQEMVNRIKYIMEHSPLHDRWNNVWLDIAGLSGEDILSLNDSFKSAGLAISATREQRNGNKYIPSSMDIILNEDALEKGVSDPVWGETLTKIKASRERVTSSPIQPTDLMDYFAQESVSMDIDEARSASPIQPTDLMDDFARESVPMDIEYSDKSKSTSIVDPKTDNSRSEYSGTDTSSLENLVPKEVIEDISKMGIKYTSSSQDSSTDITSINTVSPPRKKIRTESSRC